MTHPLLKRVTLPKHIKPKDLIGLPFDQWDHTPWWWNGWTTKEYIGNGQYHRARAVIEVKGKRMSPARILWEHFTGVPAPAGRSFRHRCQGLWRGLDKDDVNPSNYVIASAVEEPKFSITRGAQANEELVWLMHAHQFYPTTTEELIARWPDAADIPVGVLEATLEKVNQ